MAGGTFDIDTVVVVAQGQIAGDVGADSVSLDDVARGAAEVHKNARIPVGGEQVAGGCGRPPDSIARGAVYPDARATVAQSAGSTHRRANPIALNNVVR